MFEAFKVGITIALTNTVSSALMMMSKDFAATDAAALKLKATLNEIKVLGTKGIILTGMGVAGFAMIDKTYEAAKRYEQAFARFKALNLGDVMNDQADRFARSTNTIGASSTQLMATIRDLTAVTGDPKLALELAPKFAQMAFANKAMFGEGHGMTMDEAQIRALEKIIEIKGGYKDSATFLKQADMMQKVISGTGGMVKPSDFLAFIKTAGVSGRLLDNESFYYTMEPLIQEMSGNRVGTGMMSAYNNLGQGRSTVRAAREMMKLGLLNQKDVDYDKIGQVKAIHPGALKGFDEYTTNPYAWMKDTLIPALTKAGFTTQQAMINEMGAIFGNRTGSNLFSLMLMQQSKIEKNVAIDKNAMGREDLFKQALKTPQGAEDAYTAAMERLKASMGRSLIPVVIPAIIWLTKALNFLGDFFAHHPNVATVMIYTFTAIAGFLTVAGGLMLLAAGFLALKLAFVALAPVLIAGGWITLIVGGVALAIYGAYQVYKHWSEIKTWMASVWHDIVDWLSDLVLGILHIKRSKDSGPVQIPSSYSGSTAMMGGSGLTYQPSNTSGAAAFTAPPKDTSFTIENKIHIDGRVIAQGVTQHIYDGMNIAPATGSNFDPTQSFSPASP